MVAGAHAELAKLVKKITMQLRELEMLFGQMGMDKKNKEQLGRMVQRSKRELSDLRWYEGVDPARG